LFTLKTDVNVSTVSKSKKFIFCWFLESHQRKEQDSDPDPQSIRIQFKMVTNPEVPEQCSSLMSDPEGKPKIFQIEILDCGDNKQGCVQVNAPAAANRLLSDHVK